MIDFLDLDPEPARDLGYFRNISQRLHVITRANCAFYPEQIPVQTADGS
jgi:hypothetical protein